MGEVDPDVAEILNDLPPARLPESLTAAGWGQKSMRQVLRSNPSKKRPPTQGNPQPEYKDHCAQCGRPVTTDHQGMLVDHAARPDCPSDLRDRVSMYHITKADVQILEGQQTLGERQRERYKRDYLTSINARLDAEIERLRRQAAKKAAARAAPCSATAHRRRLSPFTHTCQCTEKGEHFGFHHCKTCGHLWR